MLMIAMSLLHGDLLFAKGSYAVQDMARGSLSTVRQGIQRAESDLSAKEHRNIDSKYRNQLLELKTSEMAASDLNEYHKVESLEWLPALLCLGP